VKQKLSYYKLYAVVLTSFTTLSIYSSPRYEFISEYTLYSILVLILSFLPASLIILSLKREGKVSLESLVVEVILLSMFIWLLEGVVVLFWFPQLAKHVYASTTLASLAVYLARGGKARFKVSPAILPAVAVYLILAASLVIKFQQNILYTDNIRHIAQILALLEGGNKVVITDFPFYYIIQAYWIKVFGFGIVNTLNTWIFVSVSVLLAVFLFLRDFMGLGEAKAALVASAVIFLAPAAYLVELLGLAVGGGFFINQLFISHPKIIGLVSVFFLCSLYARRRWGSYEKILFTVSLVLAVLVHPLELLVGGIPLLLLASDFRKDILKHLLTALTIVVFIELVSGFLLVKALLMFSAAWFGGVLSGLLAAATLLMLLLRFISNKVGETYLRKALLIILVAGTAGAYANYDRIPPAPLEVTLQGHVMFLAFPHIFITLAILLFLELWKPNARESAASIALLAASSLASAIRTYIFPAAYMLGGLAKGITREKTKTITLTLMLLISMPSFVNLSVTYYMEQREELDINILHDIAAIPSRYDFNSNCIREYLERMPTLRDGILVLTENPLDLSRLIVNFRLYCNVIPMDEVYTGGVVSSFDVELLKQPIHPNLVLDLLSVYGVRGIIMFKGEEWRDKNHFLYYVIKNSGRTPLGNELVMYSIPSWASTPRNRTNVAFLSTWTQRDWPVYHALALLNIRPETILIENLEIERYDTLIAMDFFLGKIPVDKLCSASDNIIIVIADYSRDYIYEMLQRGGCRAEVVDNEVDKLVEAVSKHIDSISFGDIISFFEVDYYGYLVEQNLGKARLEGELYLFNEYGEYERLTEFESSMLTLTGSNGDWFLFRSGRETILAGRGTRITLSGCVALHERNTLFREIVERCNPTLTLWSGIYEKYLVLGLPDKKGRKLMMELIELTI